MDAKEINDKLKEDRMFKRAHLEKEYERVKKRRDSLRKTYYTYNSLDQAFVKKNIDKCTNEMERISKLLSQL